MHRRRTGRIAAAVITGAVVLVIAGYLALRYLDIEAAREVVVQRLEAITGREVVIEGDFDLVLSLAPTLAAEGLVIANAGWASEVPMLQARRVEVQFQVVPLLWEGDLLVDRLSVSGADLLLETGPDGRANWQFGPPAPGAPQSERREFLLSEVAIRDSRLRWGSLGAEQTATVALDRIAWRAPTVTGEVSLAATGEWQEQPFDVSGDLGPLADLLAGEGAYPVALEGSLGPLIAQIEGRVRLAEDALDLDLAVSGDRFARLGDFVDMELPALGAYEVSGTLTGSSDALALVDVSGAVGAAGAPALRITSGAITDVLAGEGILADVSAEGSELADLTATLGFEIAPFGPYQASGTLEGSVDSLSLRQVEASAGDEAALLSVSGAIGEVLELEALDLAATVEGTDLAALSPLVGFGLPPSEPYRLAGQITGAIGDLRIDDLEIRIADSRLTGWLGVERFEAEPPRLTGALAAERLDVDRLLALAEGEPGAAQAAADGPLGEPLPLGWLDEIEAEITFEAEQVLLGQGHFESAGLSLVLQEGRLSVQDLVLQLAGGSLSGGAAIEAQDRGDFAEVSVRLNARDIDVAKVLSDWTATERAGGEIDIDINVDATGRSTDELLATLEGSATMVGEEGQVEDAPLDLLVTDLDILRALPPFWGRGDDDVRINCLITEMDIEEGVAQTEAMLDTRRMTLLGQGTIDLGEEQLDLVLRPRPKTQKLSTLAVPVDITGSLSEPEVSPRAGTAVGQAVRGVLGGLLIPLNQLSAVFGKETVDACREALQQAGGRTDPARSEPPPAE